MRWRFMSRISIDKNVTIIIVDVFLQNKGIQKKVRMALDTGASYVMIPWDVAEALNLEPALSSEKIETVPASGVEKAPVVTIEIINVLGCEAARVKALVHDLPAKSYVDGLLGLSFLKNFNITLNFKEGILKIE